MRVQFRFPTDIRFGYGVSELLVGSLKDRSLARPLVVTDAGLGASDLIAGLVQHLQDGGLAPRVYSDASGNPVASHVGGGVEAYRDHQADSVVLVGGGCAVDVGKAVALMVHHPGDLFDYEDDLPGARPIDQQLPFMVALPTTSGTGSEVGGSSVIAHDTTHKKVIIWSSRLIPPLVLADPQLTESLPPAVTAATGIDALTHNVEAYLAPNYHPMCDGIALEGVRLVAQNLEKAFESPSDSDARSGMLLASMMGAVAFQKGLGVTHSCAHALSTCYGTHHGLANGVMLTSCMAYNGQVVPERMQSLAYACGLGHLEVADAPEAFCGYLGKLLGRLKIPTLGQLKVEVHDDLLDVAVADPCHANNPRRVSRDDFRSLFNKALAANW